MIEENIENLKVLTDLLITDQEQRERNRSFLIDVLMVLNLLDVKCGYGAKLLDLIADYTHADAVAIRLKRLEDYHYFLYLGFPEDFIQTENSLLCKNEEIFSLECLCGFVLSSPRQVKSKYSFFTNYGSFFTPNLSELTSSTDELLPNITLRGTCVKAGYNTMALIPLYCSDASTIGLLQVNSRKTNAFDLINVQVLESISLHMGVALERMRDLLIYKTECRCIDDRPLENNEL